MDLVHTSQSWVCNYNIWYQVLDWVPGCVFHGDGEFYYIIYSGGSNGSEYLDSVECYDPSKLKWVLVTKLPAPRFSAAAVVISKRDHIAPEGP